MKESAQGQELAGLLLALSRHSGVSMSFMLLR